MAIHFLKIIHKICVYNFISFPVTQRPRIQENQIHYLPWNLVKNIKLKN